MNLLVPVCSPGVYTFVCIVQDSLHTSLLSGPFEMWVCGDHFVGHTNSSWFVVLEPPEWEVGDISPRRWRLCWALYCVSRWHIQVMTGFKRRKVWQPISHQKWGKLKKNWRQKCIKGNIKWPSQGLIELASEGQLCSLLSWELHIFFKLEGSESY